MVRIADAGRGARRLTTWACAAALAMLWTAGPASAWEPPPNPTIEPCYHPENGPPINFPCAPEPIPSTINGSNTWTVPLSAAAQDATGVRGDPGASGSSTLYLYRTNNKICASTSWSGIDSPVVAGHIHGGAYGQPENPGITINLFDPDFINGVASPAWGCEIVPAPAIRVILRCPQQFNIVVHSKQHPAGAIRGQLGTTCSV